MKPARVPGLATNVKVIQPNDRLVDYGGQRPPHHTNDGATRFNNPWPSFKMPNMAAFVTGAFSQGAFSRPSVPSDLAQSIVTRKPDWGVGAVDQSQIKATWLGHACFLVELPTPPGAARGPRILFDPALSKRCSPSQWIGPARLLDPPCPTEDIPAVDAVVLSHNHYDHTDTITLRLLKDLHNPHIFMPLGNESYLESIGYDSEHAHCLDWWEQRVVQLDIPSDTAAPQVAGAEKPASAGVATEFRLTCTPCQHLANRGLFDRWHTLWSSWALESLLPSNEPASEPRTVGAKVYFGGDTGYSTVTSTDEPGTTPVCPAFAEIGQRFGSFDLALLPIGAYHPQPVFSCMHASPNDSVRIFKDIRARRALGMHWGTWILTAEPILQPPKDLADACQKAGLEKGQFDVCDLGETRFFSPFQD